MPHVPPLHPSEHRREITTLTPQQRTEVRALIDNYIATKDADDPTTTDIVVTGPADGHVNRAGMWTRFDPGFASPEGLEEWARRFAERHGHHVDHASPEVDFAIARPRGRFHVVIPPIAGQCAQVSIRCLRLVRDARCPFARGNVNEYSPGRRMVAAKMSPSSSLVVSNAFG